MGFEVEEFKKSEKQETMMANDTFIAKWSDKKMEGDEGLNTLECLRGRLLAERASSKAANHESEQISKKVIELEKQLKIEIKSRNKAEKRLKFLIKKLQSLNISYVSADEFSSSFSEKSEISSVSSSKSQDHSGERRNCPSHEDSSGCLEEVISGNSNENMIQSSKKDDDHNGSKSPITKNDINNEEHAQDSNHNVDNSMALVIFQENVNTKTLHIDKDQDDNFDNSRSLVVVDSMVKEEKQDLVIPTGNVKDVLDELKYARESLQASMKMRRHMNSNIARARPNSISC